MKEDKERWNRKHKIRDLSTKVSKVLEEYLKVAKIGKALDIACGTGRHTHFLVDHGFMVDAVDYSDIALSKIKDISKITKIDTDLDSYEIQVNHYDLIINFNYLNHKLIPKIKTGLKEDGIVIFETFINANNSSFSQPKNPSFLLNADELCELFSDLEIIYYREHVEINKNGDRVKIASLVAKKI